MVSCAERSKPVCHISKQILDGSFLYQQPWFYNNKLALRCELGIGEDKEYMDNAFRRAINIANILFDNKRIDAAFYHRYFDKDGYAYDGAGFVLNIDEIVELDRSMLLDLQEIDDDTSAVKRYISYNIDFVTFESILKSQIECQLNPLMSFVSFDNQCIFSVYDDRGCDIVFFDVEKYKEFYIKLEQYFLDYDRETMRKTYESV